MADEQPFPVMPAVFINLKALSLNTKSARSDITVSVQKSRINLIISEALLKNQEIKELLLFGAEVFGVFRCFSSAMTVKFEISFHEPTSCGPKRKNKTKEENKLKTPLKYHKNK